MQQNVIRFPMNREVPYNADAEHGLLGALLRNNRAHEKIAGFLKGEHFYDPAHGRIYEVASRLIGRGQLADEVTLKRFFEADPALEHVGGASYLAELSASVISTINVEHYASVIRDCALRRRLIDIGTDMIGRAVAQDLDTHAADVITATEMQLFELAETGSSAKPRKLFEFMREHVADIEEAQSAPDGLVGLTTGLIDLDAVLRGIKAPDLIIIAGRPAMGKSALAWNMCCSITGAGGKPLFISEEMSGKQLAARTVADMTGISVQDQLGKLEPQQMAAIRGAMEFIRESNLWIEETPNLSIATVRSMARRHKRQHGLDLLVVDYLQLLNASGGDGRPENRVQEISAISRGLKAIAKELNIPVIALSQLSRAVESREDKRPKLSDLRESGSIEQDADIVIFPFRLEYYLAKEEPVQRDGENRDKFHERHSQWMNALEECAGTAEIIIAKFRQGATDSVKVAFEGVKTRFFDLARGVR